jgi:hypothetical protein
LRRYAFGARKLTKRIEGCHGILTRFNAKLGRVGLSLLEISVAAGLLSVVSLGVAQMMQNSGKAQRTLAMSNDFELTVQRITQTLTKDDACSSFYRDYSSGLAAAIPSLPVNTSPGAFTHPLSAITYDSDGPGGQAPITLATTLDPPQTGLRITSIAFIEKKFLGTRPTAGGGDVHLVTLRIQGERRLPSVTGPTAGVGGSLVTKDLTLTVLRDAAGNPDGCHSNWGATDFCSQVGGTWDPGTDSCDIGEPACQAMGGTYSTGTTPRCLLPTVGNLANPQAPTSVANVCLSLGGVSSPGQAECDVVNARCQAAGGELAGVFPNNYCNMLRPTCIAMGGTPTGAPTSGCDMRAPICVGSGGNWNGATQTCQRQLRRGNCFSYRLGEVAGAGQGDDFFRVYNYQCPNGSYIADIAAHQNRINGDADGIEISVQCCTPQ